MQTAVLMKEAIEGSVAAQSCLYEKFAPQMLVLCRRFVKRQEDAEELMLDGFVQFFTHLAQCRHPDENGVFRWLERIMINVCLGHMRTKINFSILSIEDAGEIMIPEKAHANLNAAEVFILIAKMPAGYRTVFTLYALYNMTHSEIAKEMKISESTSKSQYIKAKNIYKEFSLRTMTMPQENEFKHWRDISKGLTEIPGERPADHAALFARLQEKLAAAGPVQAQPQLKSCRLQRWAIACLLACLLTAMLWPRRAPLQTEHEIAVKPHRHALPLVTAPETIAQDQNIAKRQVPQRTVPAAKLKINAHTAENTPAYKSASPVIIPDTANTIAIIQVPAPGVTTYSPPTPEANAIKRMLRGLKRMPVVHINEIEKAGQEPATIATNTSSVTTHAPRISIGRNAGSPAAPVVQSTNFIYDVNN